MAAGNYTLALEAGALYAHIWTWQSAGVPVNLTGYTARLQVRRKLDDEEPALELTTENGGLTLGGAAGTIEIRITAVQTAALAVGDTLDRLNRFGRYDLEMIPSAGETDVIRLLEGSVTLSGNVTRA